MDKYEYKLRADEIKSLIGQGRYQEAADLADTIDWRRVKSISMLGTISDLYKINRRYEESKNVLLMAYDRFPEGRSVVYSLCELAIKTGEIVQAIEYYKEFVRVAPRDTARYILQYKLYEAQEVGIEERIAVLEELKKHDYRDKWAYELALLYHRAGLKERCVEECDNIALHFEMSRYVARALELKQVYAPLSETQETRLAIFTREHPEHAAMSADRLGIAAEQKMNLAAMQQETAQTHRGNTQEIAGGNLEEALQHSTPVAPEEELPAEEAEAGYAPLELPEEEVPAEVVQEEEVPAEDEQEEAYAKEDDAEAPQQEVGVSFHTMNLQEALADNIREVLDEDEARAKRGPVLPHMTGNTRPMPYAQPAQYAEDMMDTAATRLFNDAEMAQIQAAAAGAPASPIPEPKPAPKPAPAPAPEPMPFMEVKPGMVVKPMRRPKPNHFERMLTEGADGQISLFVEEEAMVEQQVSGQLSIQDILQQWEDSKKRQQENQMAQVRQRVADETGDMFERFDAEVKGGLHAQLESAVNDAIRKDKYARATGRDKDEDAYADLERTTKEIIMAHSGRTGDMQIYDLENALEAEEKKRDVEIDNIPDAIEPGDLAEAIEKRHAQEEDGWAADDDDDEEEIIEEEDDEIDSSLSGMEKVIAAAEAAAIAAGVDEDEDAIAEGEVESLYVEEAPIEEVPDEETPWEEAAAEAAAEREAEEDDADVEVEFYEAEGVSDNTGEADTSEVEETPPARSIEELRATAPWRMLEEEETPHQSAALTASPQGEALDAGASETEEDVSRIEEADVAEAEEVEESEETESPATLDEILEQEIAASAPEDGADENLLPQGSAEDIVENIIAIGGLSEVEGEALEIDTEASDDTTPALTGMAKVIAAAEAAAAAREGTEAEESEATTEATEDGDTVEDTITPDEDADELREEITEEITDDLEELEDMMEETSDTEEAVSEAEPGATTADIPGISAELSSLLDELEPEKDAAEESAQEEPEEEPPNEEDDFLIEAPPDVGVEELSESAWRSSEEEALLEEGEESPGEVDESGETPHQSPEDESQSGGTPHQSATLTASPQGEALEEEAQEKDDSTEGRKDKPGRRNGRDEDDPVDKEMEARVRAMTQEEKVLFGPYIMQKSSRRQIINAIDNMSMAADVGNAIVTGEEGAGSLSLAKGLIRSVQLSDSNFSGKVAKISGSALNNKDIPSIFEQLNDGALIIHKAGGMNEQTAASLRKALRNETKGMIVILEDTKKAMNRLLKDNESLTESFSVRVDIEPLDDDALISYAKKYAEKRGYMIDEFGILALHTVIDDLQTIDHSVTLAEVKEIVDKAILHADKKDAGYFFDVLLRKRYSDEDMVVLHEKDFMAIR